MVQIPHCNSWGQGLIFRESLVNQTFPEEMRLQIYLKQALCIKFMSVCNNIYSRCRLIALCLHRQNAMSIVI